MSSFIYAKLYNGIVSRSDSRKDGTGVMPCFDDKLQLLKYFLTNFVQTCCLFFIQKKAIILLCIFAWFSNNERISYSRVTDDACVVGRAHHENTCSSLTG